MICSTPGLLVLNNEKNFFFLEVKQKQKIELSPLRFCLCVTIKTNHQSSCETKWLHTSVFSTKGALNPKRILCGFIRVAMVAMKPGQLHLDNKVIICN